MPRSWLAVVTSLCALAVAPSAALADTANGGVTGTLVHQAQSATNENKTEQTATSEASSEQVNVNAPVAVMSPGANDGDVHQSNQAETVAASQNNNETAQGNFQNQEASVTGGKGDNHGSCGCDGSHGEGGQEVDQSQEASNSNETQQQASSEAQTKQVNVNAPVAVMSPGANDGDVHQSNQAETVVLSQNNNQTAQGNFQNQEASAADGRDGGNHGACGCGQATGYGQGPAQGNGGPAVDQSQTASNNNETTQNAEGQATTEQENINAPSSKPSSKGDNEVWGAGGACACGKQGHHEHAHHGDHGAKGGDVHRSNQAETVAESQNNNATEQRNSQNQEASAAGGNRGPCGCGQGTGYGPDHGDGGPTVDQSQTASNSNETTQNAQSQATGEQENVNKGRSEEGAPKETLPSGPSGDGCGCGVSGEQGANGGEVGQSNLAETLAASENNNQTAQRNFQAQEGAIT
jgi:hypothetical protein